LPLYNECHTEGLKRKKKKWDGRCSSSAKKKGGKSGERMWVGEN